MSRRPARTARWFDDRLGLSHFADSALNHIFPDHWSFMLGEVAFYCFVILLITGVYLTFFFHASSTPVVYTGNYGPLRGTHMSDAYASVVHLSFDVRAGLVVRQIHHWTANVFAAAVVCHLCRIFFTGAFRRPRELNWVIGLTLLLLVLFNGFAGYSLPDDLLSATGLRIAYSILLSVPFVGAWLASLFFGGAFPGPELIGRLFIIHVLLFPALIAVLLSVHLAIIWRQKHTQFRGGGRTERNLVGSKLWPTYAAKSLGLLAAVVAVVAALGGLAQINPVWLYGPYRTGAVSTAAQPDWYMGWLEGAVRLFPAWRIHVAGHTVPEIFWPGVVLPAATFGLLYLYPWVEARLTRDRRRHELLDRPRNRPVRTAFGLGVLSFYVVLFFAGSQDIIAQHFEVSVVTVNHTFQVLVFVVPAVVAAVAWKWCRDLTLTDQRAVSIEPQADPSVPSAPARRRGWAERAHRVLGRVAQAATVVFAVVWTVRDLARPARPTRPAREARPARR